MTSDEGAMSQEGDTSGVGGGNKNEMRVNTSGCDVGSGCISEKHTICTSVSEWIILRYAGSRLICR